MLTLKAKVVSCRVDENGDPDVEKHHKVTRGRRNVPVLAASGKPAVDEEGVPKTQTVDFAHVYFQPDAAHPFHLEMPADQAAQFTIGREVTITITVE